MRALICAVTLALLPMQAHAQGKARPDTSPKENAAADTADRERKANEAAAKAAMEKIPDSKEKYDPWRSAR